MLRAGRARPQPQAHRSITVHDLWLARVVHAYYVNDIVRRLMNDQITNTGVSLLARAGARIARLGEQLVTRRYYEIFMT